MAKHSENHLATEQLSAFLDKQLSAEEQSVVEAHLQNCQRCQDALARLRQTALLLNALPQPALPRSFVLSPGVSYLQQRPEQESAVQRPATSRTETRRTGLSNLQRMTRVVSTLVAVIGLFFLLSAVLPTFSRGSMNSSGSATSAPVNGPAIGSSRNQHATSTVKGTVPHTQGGSPTSSTEPTKTPSVTPVATATSAQHITPQTQNVSQLSDFLPDVTTSQGRLEIGFFCLALALIGLLLTRRKQSQRAS